MSQYDRRPYSPAEQNRGHHAAPSGLWHCWVKCGRDVRIEQADGCVAAGSEACRAVLAAIGLLSSFEVAVRPYPLSIAVCLVYSSYRMSISSSIRASIIVTVYSVR